MLSSWWAMTGDHLPVQFSEGIYQIRSDQILLLEITVMRQQVNAEFYAVFSSGNISRKSSRPDFLVSA